MPQQKSASIEKSVYINSISEENTPAQVCHKGECKNGGSCNIIDGSKRCTCTKGYRGIACEGTSLIIDTIITEIFGL